MYEVTDRTGLESQYPGEISVPDQRSLLDSCTFCLVQSNVGTIGGSSPTMFLGAIGQNDRLMLGAALSKTVAGVDGSGREYPELSSTSQETVTVSEYYADTGNTANSSKITIQASDKKNSLDKDVKTSQEHIFSVEAELSVLKSELHYLKKIFMLSLERDRDSTRSTLKSVNITLLELTKKNDNGDFIVLVRRKDEARQDAIAYASEQLGFPFNPQAVYQRQPSTQQAEQFEPVDVLTAEQRQKVTLEEYSGVISTFNEELDAIETTHTLDAYESTIETN